ncbi:hypothetical protein CMK11_11280 [Candidatus Poribacteria bacterium]|nr:hypothetical protein [Candidatus Poribacteria bacterium]
MAGPVSESVAGRYGLDKTSADSLRQSLRASLLALADDTSAREELVATMARAGSGGLNAILVALLSQPTLKAALAEQLTAEQLRDYVGSHEARQRRDRHAAHRYIMVWAEDHFLLMPDQRAEMERSLDAYADDKGRVFAKGMVWNQELHGLLRGAVEPSADSLLSEAQLVLWRALLPPLDADREKIMAMVRAGEMTREQAGQRLEAMDREAADNDERGRQDAARAVAAARLMTHMQQLGSLDDSATQRLALVAKGAVERHLDDQSSDADERVRAAEAQMMAAVEGGLMTREQLEERLGGLRQQIRGEQRAATGDVTEDLLYQQTIEDVLSEEAYAQYEERRAQRHAAREQASRDLAAACVDSHLLLADDQRQRVEAIAAELAVPSEMDGVPSTPFVLYDLAQRTDRELLSPWQQDQLQAMGRELGFDRIEWMRGEGRD